jgi:hypothetical protein
MKSHAKHLITCLCLTVCHALSSRAATVWTGPTVNFVNLPGSDPAQATNQDRLTPNVWITRGSSQGIYNRKTEALGFAHFLSPADTQWADGTTANYSTLSYTDWNTWAKNIHGGPFGTVGINAVVHLVSEDIYLDAQFTSWGGPGGGFSWQHSTLATTINAPPTISITSPTNGASFTATANVTITANAQDSDGSVTNVVFLDGNSALAAAGNQPYTITVNLAIGGHALTAVATDDGGLSTTSSVVNVTVSLNRLTISPIGNALDISWPVAGGRLQTQTNNLGHGWVDVPNSSATNHIIVPVDPSNGSVFYRLSVP